MSFIDFEFTAYNYEAHDIAMLFCDYAGDGLFLSIIIGHYSGSAVLHFYLLEILYGLLDDLNH